MNDMLNSIAPKSSQLNSDDLVGNRTLTIKVTAVKGVSGDQPIAISYDGDGGKPFMPCKSMRRVLVTVWGNDGKEYVGRSMTLYRDPTVLFGGIAVGGIRISHMSHMTEPMVIALTANKSQRKPFTVRPLVISDAPILQNTLDEIAKAKDLDALKTHYNHGVRTFTDDDSRKQLTAVKEKRKGELTNDKQIPA